MKSLDQLWTIYSYNIRRNASSNKDDVEVDFSTMDIEQVKKMLEAQANQRHVHPTAIRCTSKEFLISEKRRWTSSIRSQGLSQTKTQSATNALQFSRRGKVFRTSTTRSSRNSTNSSMKNRGVLRNSTSPYHACSTKFHFSSQKKFPFVSVPQTVKQMSDDLSNALVFLQTSGETRTDSADSLFKLFRLIIEIGILVIFSQM